MNPQTSILISTAFFTGFLHTVLGPDHYVPLVAISRSAGWSRRKTFWITALCGMGHVLASVVIGSVGLLLGAVLIQLQAVDAFRGEAAAWLLIGFGLAHCTWGIVHAYYNLPHEHHRAHSSVTAHPHKLGNRTPSTVDLSLAPWVMILIFAFGPCEALIPLMMYPAASADMFAIGAVVFSFAAATMVTMLIIVMMLLYGLRFVKFQELHKFGHVFAGLTILICGVLVKLGW